MDASGLDELRGPYLGLHIGVDTCKFSSAEFELRTCHQDVYVRRK